MSASYDFADAGPSWIGDTRVRLGVVNLTNVTPPLASSAFGYDPGVSQSLLSGRTWSLEVTRRF